VFIAVGAELLAHLILVVRATTFDRIGLPAHGGNASSRACARAAERGRRRGSTRRRAKTSPSQSGAVGALRDGR
jgi:hypothetical protein